MPDRIYLSVDDEIVRTFIADNLVADGYEIVDDESDARVTVTSTRGGLALSAGVDRAFLTSPVSYPELRARIMLCP